MIKSSFNNRNNRNCIQWLSIILGFALCSSSAFAALMTVSAVAPISFAPTNWINTLQFPKFDPTLGTLTSVQLNLSSALNTTLTVTNSAASVSSGTAKTELLLAVQDAGNLFGSTPQLDYFSPGYAYSLSPSQSTSSPLLSGSGTSSDVYSLAAILAEFKGIGNISLTASASAFTALANSGGNTFSSQVSSANANGEVVYTFTPVPEPHAAAMLCSACIGLAASRRRRTV